MKNVFFLVLFFGFTSVFAQQELDRTMNYGGLTREYHLYIPAIYHGNKAVPLLFNVHGLGSNNLQQETYAYFNAIADTANFIVCLPNGSFLDSSNRFWNAGFASYAVDDVGFLSALIDELYRTYNIDSSRVYFTGMSNGGFMSHSMACRLSDKIAAVASVAGSMAVNQFNTCSPSRPVPVMEIHGDEDAIVDYFGSMVTYAGINLNIVAIDTLIKKWGIQNGCTGSPTETAIPDINTADGCTATRYAYDCSAGTSVVLYKITGGGHTWPGSFPISMNGRTNLDFNATIEIWKFLRQYKNPNSVIGISNNNAEKLQPHIYPNPCENLVNIKFGCSANIFSYQLSDIHGKSLKRGLIENNSFLSMTDFPQGIYILSVIADEFSYRCKIIKK